MKLDFVGLVGSVPLVVEEELVVEYPIAVSVVMVLYIQEVEPR